MKKSALLISFAFTAVLMLSYAQASQLVFASQFIIKSVPIKALATPSVSVTTVPDPSVSVFVIEQTLLTGSNLSVFRQTNHTFYNEQIEYYLLARHSLNKSFLLNSYVLVGPNSTPTDNMSGVICSNKTDFLFRNGNGTAYINATTGQSLVSGTDKLFHCLLTAAPAKIWNGSMTVFPIASSAAGIAWQNFTWLFNPVITNISVLLENGSIERSRTALAYNLSGVFPSSFSVRNDNQVEVMLFMAGSDLFGKKAPGASCLGKNTYDVRNIQYRAVSGVLDSGLQPVRKLSTYGSCNQISCKSISGPNGIPLYNGLDPFAPTGQIVLPGQQVNITLQSNGTILCTSGYDRGVMQFLTLALS